MTGPQDAGWSSVTREIVAAAVAVAAITAAAAALYSPATAGIVALGAVILALAGLRALVPAYRGQPPPPDFYGDIPTTSFVGFWRTQLDLNDAVSSMSAWDLATRGRMQNLLAARLAERHGVSLAADPRAAREIFIGQDRARGDQLWYWIDPTRATPPDASSEPGIPPKTLAALIHRLEQL